MQIYHIGDRMGIVLSLSSQKMDSPNSSNSCSFAFCWIHDSDWSCHPVTLSKICLRSAHEFRRPFGSPKRKRIWTISGYTGVFIFPTTMMCYQGRSNHSKSHKVTISRTSGCAKLSLDDSNIFCCLGFLFFPKKRRRFMVGVLAARERLPPWFVLHVFTFFWAGNYAVSNFGHNTVMGGPSAPKRIKTAQNQKTFGGGKKCKFPPKKIIKQSKKKNIIWKI